MWNFEKYPAALRLVMDDGYDRALTLLPENRLTWEGAEYAGEALEFGEGLYFLPFDAQESPRINLTLILDMEAGLVTLIRCRQGVNPKRPSYIATEIVPGFIDLPGRPEPLKRHGYTRDLVGKCIRWDYDWGFSIVHVYLTEHTYRIRLLQKMGDPDSPYEIAMKNYVDHTEPGYFLRIRPGVVLFGFTEDHMDRVTGPEISCSSRAQLIDLNKVETVGRGFGMPGPMDIFRAKGAFVEPLPGELDPACIYYV